MNTRQETVHFESMMKAANLDSNEHELAYVLNAFGHDRGLSITAASTIYTSKLLERALGQHAQALTRSAEASNRAATWLMWATWVMSAATIVIGVTGIVSAGIAIATFYFLGSGS